MPEFNPLAYRQAGSEYVGNALDGIARRRAGAQMAQDPTQAIQTLNTAGLLDDASQIETRQRAANTADRALVRQDEEDDNKWLLQSAQGLLAVPYEQRASVYQAQVRPRLEQRLDAEELARVDAADMSDGELRAIVTTLGGSLPSLTAADRAGGDGAVVRPDPYSGQYTEVYRPAFDARAGASPGYMWTDETRTAQRFIPGGQADPAQVGVIDAARRDPPRARASGGGSRSSSGGGSRSSAPAGRPWERSW